MRLDVLLSNMMNIGETSFGTGLEQLQSPPILKPPGTFPCLCVALTSSATLVILYRLQSHNLNKMAKTFRVGHHAPLYLAVGLETVAVTKSWTARGFLFWESLLPLAL